MIFSCEKDEEFQTLRVFGNHKQPPVGWIRDRLGDLTQQIRQHCPIIHGGGRGQRRHDLLGRVIDRECNLRQVRRSI